MYNLRILAEGSTIVVLLIKLDFKLRATLYEVCSPPLANWLLIADIKQRIGHLFNVSKPRRISLLY